MQGVNQHVCRCMIQVCVGGYTMQGLNKYMVGV